MSQSVNVSNIQIDINGEDKKQIDNLIRILAKAKTEVQGVEMLAGADAMRWLSSFQAKIERVAIAKAKAEQEANIAAIAALKSPIDEVKETTPTKITRRPRLPMK